MKTEQNNLDRLKGKNPFTVPEGYSFPKESLKRR